MSIPEIGIEFGNGVSAHLYGVHMDPEGYWVEFSIREGLDGSDLITLKQQVLDGSHKMKFDNVISVARRTLVHNLEELTEDIRLGRAEKRKHDEEFYDKMNYTADEIIDDEEN